MTVGRRGRRRKPVVRFDIDVPEEQVAKVLLELEHVVDLPRKRLAKLMGMEPVRLDLWEEAFMDRYYHGNGRGNADFALQDPVRMKVLLEFCRRTGIPRGEMSKRMGWPLGKLTGYEARLLEKRRRRLHPEEFEERRGRRPKYLARHLKNRRRRSSPVPTDYEESTIAVSDWR